MVGARLRHVRITPVAVEPQLQAQQAVCAKPSVGRVTDRLWARNKMAIRRFDVRRREPNG
jgi:hypothetical protein